MDILMSNACKFLTNVSSNGRRCIQATHHCTAPSDRPFVLTFAYATSLALLYLHLIFLSLTTQKHYPALIHTISPEDNVSFRAMPLSLDVRHTVMVYFIDAINDPNFHFMLFHPVIAHI